VVKLVDKEQPFSLWNERQGGNHDQRGPFLTALVLLTRAAVLGSPGRLDVDI